MEEEAARRTRQREIEEKEQNMREKQLPPWVPSSGSGSEQHHCVSLALSLLVRFGFRRSLAPSISLPCVFKTLLLLLVIRFFAIFVAPFHIRSAFRGGGNARVPQPDARAIGTQAPKRVFHRVLPLARGVVRSQSATAPHRRRQRGQLKARHRYNRKPQ